eukprot:TRINITY_DN23436_c0_g1_i1.p1 TRINITY_DN23436_c0_g1~~TRINITY_DN23436_c0_g1_i1.p1  ORF type:complete len:576 (+),score=138.96 TRINITY_DN23436_c0_g1_i1:83-1729(+)
MPPRGGAGDAPRASGGLGRRRRSVQRGPALMAVPPPLALTKRAAPVPAVRSAQTDTPCPPQPLSRSFDSTHTVRSSTDRHCPPTAAVARSRSEAQGGGPLQRGYRSARNPPRESAGVRCASRSRSPTSRRSPLVRPGAGPGGTLRRYSYSGAEARSSALYGRKLATRQPLQSTQGTRRQQPRSISARRTIIPPPWCAPAAPAQRQRSEVPTQPHRQPSGSAPPPPRRINGLSGGPPRTPPPPPSERPAAGAGGARSEQTAPTPPRPGAVQEAASLRLSGAAPGHADPAGQTLFVPQGPLMDLDADTPAGEVGNAHAASESHRASASVYTQRQPSTEVCKMDSRVDKGLSIRADAAPPLMTLDQIILAQSRLSFGAASAASLGTDGSFTYGRKAQLAEGTCVQLRPEATQRRHYNWDNDDLRPGDVAQIRADGSGRWSREADGTVQVHIAGPRGEPAWHAAAELEVCDGQKPRCAPAPRRAMAGDLAVNRYGMASDDGDGGWSLGEFEVAVVVDVDQDGDLILANSSGEICSYWKFASHFRRVDGGLFC